MRDSGIVAAVAVVVLTLSGCAKSPPIPAGIHTIGKNAQFGDVDSNQTTNLGCAALPATNAFVLSKPLQIGECFGLSGGVYIFKIPPGSCLVRDDEISDRFHVVACRDATPGSCETDLGDGNAAVYVSPCSGNG